MRITESRLRSIIRNVIRESFHTAVADSSQIQIVDEMIKNSRKDCFRHCMDSGDYDSVLINCADDMEDFILDVAGAFSDGMGGYGGPGGIYPEINYEITTDMLLEHILPAYEEFQESGCTKTMPLAKAIANLAIRMLR